MLAPQRTSAALAYCEGGGRYDGLASIDRENLSIARRPGESRDPASSSLVNTLDNPLRGCGAPSDCAGRIVRPQARRARWQDAYPVGRERASPVCELRSDPTQRRAQSRLAWRDGALLRPRVGRGEVARARRHPKRCTHVLCAERETRKHNKVPAHHRTAGSIAAHLAVARQWVKFKPSRNWRIVRPLVAARRRR